MDARSWRLGCVLSQVRAGEAQEERPPGEPARDLRCELDRLAPGGEEEALSAGEGKRRQDRGRSLPSESALDAIAQVQGTIDLRVNEVLAPRMSVAEPGAPHASLEVHNPTVVPVEEVAALGPHDLARQDRVALRPYRARPRAPRIPPSPRRPLPASTSPSAARSK